MLLTEPCYNIRSQAFGGATIRDMSLIETCFYSWLYGIWIGLWHSKNFHLYLATIYPLLTLLMPNFKTMGILAFNNRGPLLVLSMDFWSYFTHPDKLCQYIKYIEHYMHVHCMLVHCTYVSSRRFITWTPRIYCVDRQWGLGKSMPFWIIYRVTSIYWYDFRRSLWGHGLIQKKMSLLKNIAEIYSF